MEEILKIKKMSKRQEEVKLFIADQTKSIEERWTVFSDYCEKSKRGKVDYVPSFRINSLFYRTMLESMRENGSKTTSFKIVDFFDEYQSEMINKDVSKDNQKAQIDELKEYCMEDFIYKFNYKIDYQWKQQLYKTTQI